MCQQRERASDLYMRAITNHLSFLHPSIIPSILPPSTISSILFCSPSYAFLPVTFLVTLIPILLQHQSYLHSRVLTLGGELAGRGTSPNTLAGKQLEKRQYSLFEGSTGGGVEGRRENAKKESHNNIF